MNVSIVLPNWNGRQLLEKHLSKVIEASNKAEIIVVDDQSSDDSVQFLKKHFPNVTVVAKAKHEGFASTVNAGVERATGDIVVLLNTDVVPEKGFLAPLLPHFADADVFAVGCMDKSVEGSKVVLRGRGETSWQRGFFVHRRGSVDRPDTAWVSGGSGAFRKSLWDKLGGMDPLFNPFYWEDIDISYRARKAGYRLIFEPKSVAIHYHEKGKITQEYSGFAIKSISYRNQFLFIWKNITDASLLISHGCWTPVQLLLALLRRDLAMMVGYIAALVRAPYALSARFLVSRFWKKKDRELFSS